MELLGLDPVQVYLTASTETKLRMLTAQIWRKFPLKLALNSFFKGIYFNESCSEKNWVDSDDIMRIGSAFIGDLCYFIKLFIKQLFRK